MPLTKAWRAADVYLRKKRIYVVSSQLHGDPGGLHSDWNSLSSPPFLALEAAASDRDLGAAVQAAVDAASWVDDSTLDDSPPSAVDDPLLKLAHVASYCQLRRGLRAFLHVWENGGDFRLTCLGSQPFSSPVVNVRARDPNEVELGAAVREALSQVEEYLRRRRRGNLVTLASWLAWAIVLLALFVGLPLLLILR